ncbi:methyltransferase domain protein, partial [Vibrio parahaemolyticus VPTS-2010_2]
KPW